ncbi:MAG: deoxynucleoside kinase [Gammaproteobacteria bacterium]|nr:MAG: deoxynucleoside kinase [Gammaproteobacteria bacterium]
MEASQLDYIVVEGPIGVGKTSLVKRLAQSFGSEALLEQPADNPFLERFYRAPRQYALSTQLSYLFQRVKQIEQLKQGDMFHPGCVADFMLEKDSLFARINLDDDELRLYDQVYDSLSLDLPVPDLVVYLQAPVSALQERVRKRGIDYERYMERDYLEKLHDAYAQFFYQYSNAPLLIVNTAEVNFVGSDNDYNMLLDHLAGLGQGRHFFNPVSSDS